MYKGKMIADYHVHTPYCGHAHGKIIHYIESAIEKGIQEIGFSDHLGRYYLTGTQRRRYWDWGMDERGLVRYFSELSDLREIFAGRISIKIGLEIDYIEGAEDLLQPFLDAFTLDFCIGSIHCIPRFGWKHLSDYHAAANSIEIYSEYFRLAQAALRSGLFHSLAHPDFIWRYIRWPEQYEQIVSDLSDTVQTAAEVNRGIEINANGFIFSRSGHFKDFDPFDTLLNLIKRFNVPVTIGSDAHDPSMVAKVYPQLIGLLLEKKIDSFRTFTEGNGVERTLG